MLNSSWAIIMLLWGSMSSIHTGCQQVMTGTWSISWVWRSNWNQPHFRAELSLQLNTSHMCSTTTPFNPLFTVIIWAACCVFSQQPTRLYCPPECFGHHDSHWLNYSELLISSWTQSTMERAELLPTAETHLTITQSSYVTLSQSKHAKHTHTRTGREPQWPTLQPGVCRGRRQIRNRKMCRVGTSEAKEWKDGWDTAAGKGFN